MYFMLSILLLVFKKQLGAKIIFKNKQYQKRNI